MPGFDRCLYLFPQVESVVQLTAGWTEHTLCPLFVVELSEVLRARAHLYHQVLARCSGLAVSEPLEALAQSLRVTLPELVG